MEKFLSLQFKKDIQDWSYGEDYKINDRLIYACLKYGFDVFFEGRKTKTTAFKTYYKEYKGEVQKYIVIREYLKKPNFKDVANKIQRLFNDKGTSPSLSGKLFNQTVLNHIKELLRTYLVELCFASDNDQYRLSLFKRLVNYTRKGQKLKHNRVFTFGLLQLGIKSDRTIQFICKELDLHPVITDEILRNIVAFPQNGIHKETDVKKWVNWRRKLIAKAKKGEIITKISSDKYKVQDGWVALGVKKNGQVYNVTNDQGEIVDKYFINAFFIKNIKKVGLYLHNVNKDPVIVFDGQASDILFYNQYSREEYANSVKLNDIPIHESFKDFVNDKAWWQKAFTAVRPLGTGTVMDGIRKTLKPLRVTIVAVGIIAATHYTAKGYLGPDTKKWFIEVGRLLIETDVAKWILGVAGVIEPVRQLAIKQYEKRKKKQLDKAKGIKKIKRDD